MTCKPIHTWLSALLALSVASPGAEQEEAPVKKPPATSLLPDGSQLHGVVIPRHNKQRKLVNSLMADVVTLVNDEIMAGNNVTIDFYNNYGERNARIKLKEATFHQTIGMLHASETVTMDADSYKARGTGLHYAMRRGQGLLTGPAVTWIINTPETAMKSKTPSLIGAAGIALVASTSANAEITGRLTEDSHITPKHSAPAPVKINTVSSNPISAARQEAQQQLEKAIESSSTTDNEVKQFIEEVPLEYEKVTGNKPSPVPTEPLAFEPGPEHTVINCDGGMYFDSEKGLLVYMQNVRVNDPQYILTGADVLRVYMAQKPAPQANPATPGSNGANAQPVKPGEKTAEGAKAEGEKTKEDGPVPAIGGNFDRVEKIVATGAVRILQKAAEKGKQPVEASGALFTYNPETGEILLSGGYPWVKQGDFFARAKEPNLTLRMKKNGDFVTEGNWEMGGRLGKNIKNDKDDDKKPKPDQPR